MAAALWRDGGCIIEHTQAHYIIRHHNIMAIALPQCQSPPQQHLHYYHWSPPQSPTAAIALPHTTTMITLSSRHTSPTTITTAIDNLPPTRTLHPAPHRRVDSKCVNKRHIKRISFCPENAWDFFLKFE
jgi:hypothetical protein